MHYTGELQLSACRLTKFFTFYNLWLDREIKEKEGWLNTSNLNEEKK
jgi:hypothetical protein